MDKLILLLLLSSVVNLIGCTNQRGWSPIVDSYSNPNAYHLTQNLAECEQTARQNAGGSVNQDKADINDQFRKTYRSCLRQNGHTVIN